jgi:hypothetical protein
MTVLFEIPFGKDPQEPEEPFEEKDPDAYDALLGDNEGENTLDCGCNMVRSYRDHGVFLIQCPLHRSAKDLLDSLDLLLGVLNRDKDGDYFICQEAEHRVEAAMAAVQVATGKGRDTL